MEYFYSSFNTITGVASLAMAAIYLFLATSNKPAQLRVSITGLLIIVIFLLPPTGLISTDSATLTAIGFFKQILLWGYYGFTCWFIMNYKGSSKKKLLIFLTIPTAIAGYILTRFFTVTEGICIWTVVTIVAFSSILLPGIRLAILQYRYYEGFVRGAIAAVYGCHILFMLAAIYQLTIGFSSINPGAFFFPASVFFIVAVAIAQAISLAKQHDLQQEIYLYEKRWSAFTQNAPVVILMLDRLGRISFINTFGAKLLGYNTPEELINLNWLDNFLLHSEIPSLKKLYMEVFNSRLTTPTFKNTIKNKNGQEIAMSWVNFIVQESSENTEWVMSIGQDISGEESAGKLIHKLQQEIEKEKIISPNSGDVLEQEIIGKSKALVYAIQKARQVAVTHAPVLLEGETGVGKEMFANLIHKNSSRSDMPFIKVNCGALPKDLIEDELFGHEKGAFTSAIQARKGRFELADGGTLFLDEIGELPLDMQPKLLRALQSGEFERIGGQKTIKVDVRILAATNRNLLEEIQKGDFRSDLYYRLNVFPITIPPLMNRKEDLPELINYFIDHKCKEYKKEIENISKISLQRLLDYHWPGNIRELKNVIERAVIVSDGNTLTFDWWHGVDDAMEQVSTGQSLEQVERDHILAVMERCHWKINGENGAAEVLAMHPNTLRSKMKRLGITRPVSKNIEPVARS